MTARRLVNRLPDLLRDQNIEAKEFLGECIKRGLSYDTVNRLSREVPVEEREINTTTRTLAIMADVLQLNSIGEIIDINDSR